MERITLTFRRPGDSAEVLITIEPDGTQSIQVRGARGLECRTLTAELEADAGDVVARRMDPRVMREHGVSERRIAEDLVKVGKGGGFCG